VKKSTRNKELIDMEISLTSRPKVSFLTFLILVKIKNWQRRKLRKKWKDSRVVISCRINNTIQILWLQWVITINTTDSVKVVGAIDIKTYQQLVRSWMRQLDIHNHTSRVPVNRRRLTHQIRLMEIKLNFKAKEPTILWKYKPFRDKACRIKVRVPILKQKDWRI